MGSDAPKTGVKSCRVVVVAVFVKTFTQGLDRAEEALYNVFAKRLNAEGTESIARERIAEIFGQKDYVEASVVVDTAKEDALSKSLREMAEEMQNEDTE